MAKFIKKRFPALFVATYFIVAVSMVGFLVYPMLFTEASVAADFTNTGAPTATVGPNTSYALVLDVTIPDAWNGTAYTADILMQAGSSQYWQGSALSAITPLGIPNGFGFYDMVGPGYGGSADSEPVVMDRDGDSVYTSAADTLVDADGVVTNTPGVTALSAGDALFDIVRGDLVVADSVVTPTKVWKDYDDSGAYTGAETAGTTVGAEGDVNASLEALTNAKVTDAGAANVWDAGEGVFVSADTTYDGADTIVKGTTLQTLLLAKVSGGNDVWAGDATEGVWDDISAPTNFVNTGDTHITTETLTPLLGAAETTMALTNTNGIAVGDTVALTTTAVVSGVVSAVSTNGIIFAATAYNGDPANILAAASINSHGAITGNANGDLDLQSAGSKTITTTDSSGIAVLDDLTFTCNAGSTTGVVTAISGNDLTVTVADAGCTDASTAAIAVTTPGAVTAELTVPITALTNAKVTGANGAYAAGEGVYVSTDTTLSAGDTIVRGETLEVLTNGTVTYRGIPNGVWDGNENVYDDVITPINGLVEAGDVRLTDITAEPVVLGTPVDADAGTNVGATAGWVKEVNATWTPGDDLFIENVAGELTYSAAADIDVYTTGGLVAGDALTDFPADCDGVGAGTQACKYAGLFLDNSAAIYVDEGTAGGAAPNSVVDQQSDQLVGIGVQNTGTAVDTTDIVLLDVWADAGAAGFQGLGTDTLLGIMTVNSGDDQEWRLGGLTQAVLNGQRIFVTAALTATPTNAATLKFQIPVYNDAGLDGVATADDDVGVFMASNNDGPIDDVLLNANTQTIDSQAPTITSRVTYDADGNGRIDRIIFTTDEALDDVFTSLTIDVDGYVGETYATGDVALDNIFWVNFSNAGPYDTGAIPNTQITANTSLSDNSGNNIATDGVAVASTDGAMPIMIASFFFDLDTDGTIDTLRTAWSEIVTMNGSTGVDWTITGGSMNATFSVATNDASAEIYLDVTVTADPDETGGTAAPDIAYDNDDANNSVRDASPALNPAGTNSAKTAEDAAAPVLLSATFLDQSGVVGTADTIRTTWSEGITNWGSIGADWTITAGDINPAFSTIPVDLPMDDEYLNITVTADAGETGSPLLPTITYNNISGLIVDASPISVGLSAVVAGPVNVTDGAAPVVLTKVYQDAGANGSVETAVLTLSEVVTFTGAQLLTDFTIANEDLTGFVGSPTTITGTGTDTMTFTSGSASTNLTGVSGGTEPTIAFLDDGINHITDGANNLASFVATSLTDDAIPVRYGAIAYSDNGNDGTVDRVTMTYTEKVTYTYSDAEWVATANDLLGFDVTACTSCTNVTSLVLTASATGIITGVGAGTQPQLAYTFATQNISDAAGKDAANIGATSLADGATPVLIGGSYRDLDSDGAIDTLRVTWSESVTVSLSTAVDWTIVGGDINATFSAAPDSPGLGTDKDITVTADADETYSGVAPTVAYDNGDANDSVVDGALNPAGTTGPVTMIDLAAPVILSATFYDADAAPNDGKLDLITVVWSENINNVADGSGDWALTGTNFGTITEGAVVCSTGTAGENECDYNFTATTVKTDVGNLSLAYSALGSSVTDGATPAAAKTITSASTPAFTDAANPVVASTSPADGATGVALDASFSMTFSEAMTTADLTSVTVGRSPSFDLGTAVWSVGDTVVTSTNHDAWAGLQIYTIDLVQGSIREAAAAGSKTLDNSAIVADPYTFTTVASGGGGGGGGGGLPASVSVYSPNGGESWAGLSSHNITWSGTSTTISKVKLYYSLDRGVNFPYTIATDETNDGTYSWTVPNVPSGTVKVKIEGYDSSGVFVASDISDADFTITYVTPPVTPPGTPETPGVPTPENPAGLVAGDLFKSPLSTTVYYFGSDNKRHIFPNEKTYRSWYSDWSNVKTIAALELQQMTLGENVIVRPGTVLVKIQTDPKVYAVEPGGLLRWIPTEERIKTLYGDAWATKIIDVPLAFWGDYSFGSDISTDTHPTGTLVNYAGTTDVYYIQGAEKRKVTTAGFAANNFRSEYVLVIPATISYANGADIFGAEGRLTSIY